MKLEQQEKIESASFEELHKWYQELAPVVKNNTELNKLYRAIYKEMGKKA